jgi:hypothetical protein
VGNGCEGGPYFDNDVVEAAILDQVHEYRLHEMFLDPRTDEYINDTDRAIADLGIQIGQLEREYDNVRTYLRRLSPDDPTRDDYERDGRELKNKISQAQATFEQQHITRATLMAARDHRADVEKVVAGLRAKLASPDFSVAERTALRSKLSQAVRSF